MRAIILFLSLVYLSQPLLGNMFDGPLQAERHKLLQTNNQLKNKNKKLKKTKKKLQKQKKLFGITTVIAGATAITTTAGAIVSNKNKKNLNEQNKLKEEEIKKKIEKQNKPQKKTSLDKKLKKEDLKNCTLKTKTIFEAIDQNNLDELQCWLFKHSKSIKAEKGLSYKYTPLPYSIDEEKTKSALIILNKYPELSHVPMKERGIIISYPLLNALSKGNITLTNLLIKNKADLYAALPNGRTVLTESVDFVQTKHQTNFLRILDDLNNKGYDLNAKDKNGDTIITRGPIGGRFYTRFFISLYEKTYIERNIQNNKGNNILHLMIPYCDSEHKPKNDPVNRFELLKRVAKENPTLLSQTNNRGNTPLEEAQKQGKQLAETIFQEVEKNLQ